MHFSLLAFASVVATLTSAAPFSFPLTNGFPNLNLTAIHAVEKLAGGTLPPSGALPSALKPAGVQALQLIAANELFEVAYFTELLRNITNKVTGYEVNDQHIIDSLTAIVNVSSLSPT